MKKFLYLFGLFSWCCSVFAMVAPATKKFHMGVYLYDYQLFRAAASYGESPEVFVEKHFRNLQENGVTAIHLAVSNPEKFESIFFPLMKKYNLTGFLQLDFAYFVYGKNWTEALENARAESASNFIRKYQNDPVIAAFSVKEEVRADQVEPLSAFYQKILQIVPDAPVFIIHNNFGAADKQPPPHAQYFGTDRYSFWWEFAGDGYLSSPSFALKWLRNEAARYYAEAAERGADFVFVSTQGGMLMPTYDLDYQLKRILGDKEEVKKQKIEQYAQAHNFGFDRETVNGRTITTVWKYYRLPENCLRAVVWTGILEGARHFFCWSYMPPEKEFAELDVFAEADQIMQKYNKKELEQYHYTLAGRPGKPNPQLEEFACVAAEIAPYGQVIAEMKKTAEPMLQSETAGVLSNTFVLPGIDGRIGVVHNTNVGKWPYANKHYFGQNDIVRISRDGNLEGYEPFLAPLPVKLKFAAGYMGEQRLFSLESKSEIPVASDGSYMVEILPGGGLLLFAGTEEEFKKLP